MFSRSLKAVPKKKRRGGVKSNGGLKIISSTLFNLFRRAGGSFVDEERKGKKGPENKRSNAIKIKSDEEEERRT